jgi:cytochrome c peroxidase
MPKAWPKRLLPTCERSFRATLLIDRFEAGDKHALSPAARRGLRHFEGKSHGRGCIACHSGFNFTDESYHNIGAGMDRENADLGRYTVIGKEVDKGAFKHRCFAM